MKILVPSKLITFLETFGLRYPQVLISGRCAIIVRKRNPKLQIDIFSHEKQNTYLGRINTHSYFLQEIGIESFIWFDYDYEERTSYHDIIILKLKSPGLVINDKVQPVRLPPSKFFAENSIDDCIISGWGAPEPGNTY